MLAFLYLIVVVDYVSVLRDSAVLVDQLRNIIIQWCIYRQVFICVNVYVYYGVRGVFSVSVTSFRFPKSESIVRAFLLDLEDCEKSYSCGQSPFSAKSA